MHPRDHGAARFGQAQRLGDACIHVLAVDAQTAAMHYATLQQLVLDAGGQVGGNGKAQPDVAGHRAARIEAGGIDAHQFAVEVDQGATGIAGVDAGVGLDEVLEAGAGQVVAAHRRHDPRCHRLADAKGVADGHHEIADLELVAVGHRNGGQILGGDAHQRHVRIRVRADELGLEAAAIGQGDLHLVGVFHHMVVGQNQAELCIDDHARAQRLGDALLRNAEDASKNRVVTEGGVHPHDLLGVHADNGGQHLFQHGRQ